MSEGFALPQGGFRAPRVPFDLRCVILAGGGYLAVCGVDWLLQQWWDVPSPVAQLVALIASNLVGLGGYFQAAHWPLWGSAAHELVWWKTALTAFAFFAVWSLFGAAMLRTAAMKLTRDEPISLKEAVKFGGRNWGTFLVAPILVLLFAGVFAGVNALFGLILSAWFVGSTVLALVLFPLSLLCSLLIVVALAGGLVGLPLMWAGLAVEQNGALEAISRAFSYIFARPLQFFFGYFLVFVMMSVILIVGDHFEDVAKTTLKLGIVRSELDDAVSRPPTDVDVLEGAYRDADRVRREAEGISNIRNVADTSWWDWGGFVWMWLLLNVFVLGFKGFALYFFLGGTTSLYLHLRREVDGTDEREIYPESEEEFEQAEGAEPRWVGEGEAAPAAAEEPTPAEAPPPPPAPVRKKKVAKRKTAPKKKKKKVAKKKKAVRKKPRTTKKKTKPGE